MSQQQVMVNVISAIHHKHFSRDDLMIILAVLIQTDTPEEIEEFLNRAKEQTLIFKQKDKQSRGRQHGISNKKR